MKNGVKSPICKFLTKNKIKPKLHLKTAKMEASLLVQCLRLHAPNAGVPGLILGWGIKIPHEATQESSNAATKDPTCRN